MVFFNNLLNGIFRLLLYPFATLSPWVGLVVMAALTSVFVLWVFRKTSNQKALQEAKRRILAGFFEMRLFQNDLRALFSAQKDVLWYNLIYLRHTLKPLAWMIVPIVLILIQLDLHYGYQGLRPGQAALVRVKLASEVRFDSQALQLKGPVGLRVETPPLRIPSAHEVNWRIRPEQVGTYELQLVAGEETFRKKVQVGNRILAHSPRRVSGWLEGVFYPAEPVLSDGAPVAFIEVKYPALRLGCFGFRLHWMVPYFVLSAVFAFALRRPFKVVI